MTKENIYALPYTVGFYCIMMLTAVVAITAISLRKLIKGN